LRIEVVTADLQQPPTPHLVPSTETAANGNIINHTRNAPVCEGTKAEADAKRARRANTVFIMVVVFGVVWEWM